MDGALDANRVDVGSGDIAIHILLAHHNVRLHHAVEHSLVEPVVRFLCAGVPRVEEPSRLVLPVTEEDDTGGPAYATRVDGQ